MLVNPNQFQQPADYIGCPLKKGQHTMKGKSKERLFESRNIFFFTREELDEYFKNM